MPARFALVVGLLMIWTAVPAASGQTVITGHHDGNAAGDGFDIHSAGAYVVNADAGTAADATFNNNADVGLNGDNTGTTLTVGGGKFNGNTYGLYTFGGTTISAGAFDANTNSGATSGAAAGMLSTPTIRLHDVAALPEPGSAGVVVAAAGFAMARRRGRRIRAAENAGHEWHE